MAVVGWGLVTGRADASGNWSYTPSTPLTSGPHNVVASAQDPITGTTQSTTASFVVAGAGGETSTQSGTLVAGNAYHTLILILIGTMLLLGGTVLWTFPVKES